jgi:hypothetical protein
LEEAREVMFKQSTLRYVNLLDTEMDYSELDEVSILMLKHRRKGDLQKQKTANMVIYSRKTPFRVILLNSLIWRTK